MYLFKRNDVFAEVHLSKKLNLPSYLPNSLVIASDPVSLGLVSGETLGIRLADGYTKGLHGVFFLGY